MSRWLRINTDWSTSSWLVVLSAEARLSWIQLLCHAKAHGVDGKVKSIDPIAASRMWFVGEESVRQLLLAAQESGALLVEGGYWQIEKWKDYQGDNTAAARQERFRNKQKEAAVPQQEAEVEPETPINSNGSNALLTPTETETLTNTLNPPIIPPGGFVVSEISDSKVAEKDPWAEKPTYRDLLLPFQSSDEAFEAFRSAYPEHPGGDGWRLAKSQLNYLLQQGHSMSEIMIGVNRYFEFILATNRIVKSPQNWLREKQFLEPWAIPKAPEQRKEMCSCKDSTIILDKGTPDERVVPWHEVDDNCPVHGRVGVTKR